MWRRCVAVVTATLMGALAACGTAPPESGEPEPHQAQLSPPPDEVTVLDDSDPATLAVAVTQLLFDRAPVVLLAGADDQASLDEAAGTAVELGAPVLLAPQADGESGETDADEALAAELDRLETDTVLPVGAEAAQWLRGHTDLVADGEGASGSPATPATPATPAAFDATAPPVEPPEPLPGVAVLTGGGPQVAAATATARVAGADIQITEATDPRADPELIEALAADPPTHTIAFGAGFGSAERLRSRMAVATAGVQLPAGGQLVFPGRRMVALYGHPDDTILGSLGEQPLAETIERARQVAAEYEPLVDEPVVPTLEIITTIASAGPGPDGDYSRRTPPEELRPWVDAAREEGMYVVLDLQPGHTDFLTHAKQYEELLVEPHVGLALDPEWRLAPDQRHMVNIGSVNAAEVNEVAAWLADLVTEHRLPQKLLIVHQFTLAMIQDRHELETGWDEVAVMIHADGFGNPGQKFHTWETLRRDAPEVWWGWKNFYDEDQPTFTPAETVDIDPAPWFVSYQ